MNNFIFIKGINRSYCKKIFEWSILNTCNLNCSYCYGLHKNNFIEKDCIKRVKFLNNLQENEGVEYQIAFTGGECLLHPELENIIKENKLRYYLITNLYHDYSYIKKFVNNKLLIYVIATIHFQYNIEKVINNIKYLTNDGIIVRCNIMLENNIKEQKILDTYDKIYNIIKNKDNISLKYIYDYKNNYYKNKKNLKIFGTKINNMIKFTINNKKIDETIKKAKLYKTKRVICDIGKYFTIIYKGKYYRCYSYLLNKKNGYDFYDKNIFENDYLCSNSICNRCDLSYGTKKGIFDII